MHTKFLAFLLIITTCSGVLLVRADAEASPDPDPVADAGPDPESKPSAEAFGAEHRSAKPEPFLQRLSEALFGKDPKKKAPEKKIGRPAGPGRPRPPQHRPPPPPPNRYNNQGRPPSTLQQSLPGYKAPVNDGYGAPQAPVLDGYGAPQSPVIGPQQPPKRPSPGPAQAPTPQYQPAPSNQFPTVFGGSGGNQFGVEPWQVSQPSNMAQVVDLQVQCEKDLMRVRVEFDRPFYGMIFSKGHYSNVNCVHVPSGLGQTQATFDIALRTCGMSSSVNDGYSSPTPQGSFIENTIIIQYDPLLQEVWDQARKLRCTWYDFYEKAVTFKPYQVDMLDPVTANFLGDNLRCWMQIQVGKGPYASEVSGIVKIGQTMTMVLGVKDDENKFDMMVRNCVAHDGQRSPIQLVDEKGCVVRPKIMSPFKKIKNFDTTANVLSYAYFQAFKFPDSMNVHFQCVVQVCRGACPDPQCGGSGYIDSSSGPTGGYTRTGGASPAPDSYGSPLSGPISYNSGAINPRLPQGGQTVYTPAGSERRVTVVKPDGTEVTDLQANRSDEEPDHIDLEEPGYENTISKRVGALDLGGRPRSLDLDDVKAEPLKQTKDSVSTKKKVKNTVDSAVGEDFVVGKHARNRRSPAFDANGNRILKVVKRDATDMADLETEKVIQVLAPNDVQFSLNSEEVPEVVIESTETTPVEAKSALSQSVCMDTPAFIGVTVSILMILVIALITIVFLWMRIRSLNKKQLL